MMSAYVVVSVSGWHKKEGTGYLVGTYQRTGTLKN